MRVIGSEVPKERARAAAEATAVLVLAAAAQVETWWPGEMRGPLLAGAIGAAAMTLPLLRRRAAPLPVALVVLAAFPAQAAAGVAIDDRLFHLVSLVVVTYTVAAYAPVRAAATGLVAAVIAVFAAEVLAGAGAPGPQDLFFVLLALGTPWMLGRVVAGRQERADRFAAMAEELDRHREEHARRAVTDERERIARELHDVVAHSVSLMLVQATGGRRRLQDGDVGSAEAALGSIETIGRAALGDLRRAIGLMRDHDDGDGFAPQPGLAALDDLAARARSAGVQVALDVRGARRPLPPGLDLTAFRVVQEAVTNVAKHAPGATADVALTFGADELEIVVRNETPGKAPSNGAVPGGHGLVGMRERVGVYGGRLEAGPAPGGGFRVRARLPIERARA